MATTFTGNVRRQVINDKFVKTSHPFNELPYAAIDKIHTFSNYHYWSSDFEQYTGPATGGTAGGWQLDDVGTAAVATEDSAQFGALQIQTGGTADNNAILHLNGESFKYVSGKRMWCFARLNLSDANDAEALFGLQITTADPLGGTLATDGIFFEKSETATEWDFHARKDGTSTEDTLVTTTFTDGAYRILGFLVNANGSISAYDGTTINDLTLISTVAAGNANIPNDEDITLVFGLETGDNAAKDITVDWAFVAQEV